jgi:hypothetical protein
MNQFPFQENKAAKEKGDPDPDTRPDSGLLECDDMVLFMKNAKVKRQKQRHQQQETYKE